MELWDFERENTSDGSGVPKIFAALNNLRLFLTMPDGRKHEVVCSQKNIVCTWTATLEGLSPMTIVEELHQYGVSLNKISFKSAVALENGRSTLLFENRHVNCTGCTCPADVLLRVQNLLLRIRQQVYPEFYLSKMKIRNIVTVLILGFPIDIQAFDAKYSQNCFIKDTFPGAVFKRANPKSKKETALIFKTGKVVFIGIPTAVGILDLWNELKELLYPFIKFQPEPQREDDKINQQIS